MLNMPFDFRLIIGGGICNVNMQIFSVVFKWSPETTFLGNHNAPITGGRYSWKRPLPHHVHHFFSCYWKRSVAVSMAKKICRFVLRHGSARRLQPAHLFEHLSQEPFPFLSNTSASLSLWVFFFFYFLSLLYRDLRGHHSPRVSLNEFNFTNNSFIVCFSIA